MNVRVPGEGASRASGSSSGAMVVVLVGHGAVRSAAAAGCSAATGGRGARARRASVWRPGSAGRRSSTPRRSRRRLRAGGSRSSSTRTRRRSATGCRTSSSTRCGPLRGRRGRHQGAAATRPSCAARPPTRATTSSSTFGGDGTVNEAANGLAGSRRAAVLPARAARTNVYVQDARHPGRHRRRHRAPAAARRRLAPRRVDLGARQRPATSRSRPASASTPASSSASTPPRAQGALARALLRLGGDRDVPAPLRRPPAADRRSSRRRHGRAA